MPIGNEVEVKGHLVLMERDSEGIHCKDKILYITDHNYGGDESVIGAQWTIESQYMGSFNERYLRGNNRHFWVNRKDVKYVL